MRLTFGGILGALTLLACGTATTPVGTVDLLTTSLTVSRSTLGPFDTADVTIMATNHTTLPVIFWSRCTGPSFQVFEGAGRVDGQFCGIPEASERRIAPGDAVVSHTRFAVLQYVGSGQYRPLPAGSYALVGGWEVAGELRAASPAVAIEITP